MDEEFPATLGSSAVTENLRSNEDIEMLRMSARRGTSAALANKSGRNLSPRGDDLGVRHQVVSREVTKLNNSNVRHRVRLREASVIDTGKVASKCNFTITAAVLNLLLSVFAIIISLHGSP